MLRVSKKYGSIFGVWKRVELDILEVGSRRWIQIQIDKEDDVLCCCVGNDCTDLSRDCHYVILMDALSSRIFEFEFERSVDKSNFLAFATTKKIDGAI